MLTEHLRVLIVRGVAGVWVQDELGAGYPLLKDE
jgi:hypothetical protein